MKIEEVHSIDENCIDDIIKVVIKMEEFHKEQSFVEEHKTFDEGTTTPRRMFAYVYKVLGQALFCWLETWRWIELSQSKVKGSTLVVAFCFIRLL